MVAPANRRGTGPRKKVTETLAQKEAKKRAFWESKGGTPQSLGHLARLDAGQAGFQLQAAKKAARDATRGKPRVKAVRKPSSLKAKKHAEESPRKRVSRRPAR
jgi:hypothetical protein